MATIRSTFGVFSGETSGGGSGVTQVIAGTGLTGGTITTSGTIAKNALSEFNGGAGVSLPVLSGTSGVAAYTNSGLGTYTQVNNNRVSSGVKTVSAATRVGINGLTTGDTVTLTGQISTTCTSGTFTLAATFGGVFTSVAPTFTGNPVTCDGSSQAIGFTIPTFQVGVTNSDIPSNANSEYFAFEYTATATGGNYIVDSFLVDVNQFIK